MKGLHYLRPIKPKGAAMKRELLKSLALLLILIFGTSLAAANHPAFAPVNGGNRPVAEPAKDTVVQICPELQMGF
jgi:hypothetical protein